MHPLQSIPCHLVPLALYKKTTPSGLQFSSFPRKVFRGSLVGQTSVSLLLPFSFLPHPQLPSPLQLFSRLHLIFIVSLIY